MKSRTVFGVVAWGVLATAIVLPVVNACSDDKIQSSVNDSGMLLNDDLVAVSDDDGIVTIRNTVTNEITARNISFDWTTPSPNDSLSVFSSNGKRGYYNAYTGKIVVPAQYRRAWVFSEGLAAVQKNGHIGFIDRQGNVVIDFKFPYHGNPLSSFVFENGHCVVADTSGHCGVIDTKGKWLIKPEYKYVETFEKYAIVTKEGVRMQMDYNGNVINSCVFDNLMPLTYVEYIYKDDNEYSRIRRDVPTGLYVYRTGGLCGLMDEKCKRVTEPLYWSIEAMSKSMFKATLEDGYSEVVLNANGEVMN